MLKIGIYCRKSTDDNKRQKASIEDQKMWAHEYLKTLKVPYEIVAEYEEKKSAKAPWRPIFNEMMGQIYAGKIDTIVVWAVSRLSRNEIDEWAIKWAVREWKLKEIHTKDTIYTENELFTMGIFLSMSAEEIANFRKWVIRRMTNMVEKEGKVPFHAPMGYKNIGGGLVEVNESEAVIVKKVFERRVAGLSFQQIADELNVEWLPTRRRNYPWSKMQWNKRLVEHIVKNEFYLGVVKFMDIVGEGIFEKFISRDIWEQANNVKRMNIGYKYREFLLKGIVVWPDGTLLTASKIKGKYVYYHNNGWKIKISENEIFKKLEKVVENWKLPDDVIDMLQKYIQDTMMKEYRAIIEEKMIHEKELKTLETREFNLTKFFTEGKISAEMYEMQLAEIKKQRYQATENLQKLSALGLADLDKFEKIIELASNLLVAYKKADNELKGVIIRNAIIELQVDEQKSLKIKEKEPFYWLSLINVTFGAGNGTRTHNGRHGKAVL